ncbi:MAG: Mov34/MPN/PAD-1 family protein [Pseudomonadota bacterium]
MSPVAEIKIKRPLAMHLMGLAQRSPDAEICGLVGIRDGVLSTCYPIDNIAENPADSFLMEPEQQAAAQRAMKDKGESLYAIYHSHPSSPPVPSRRDLEEVGVDDAYYLIVSLNTKGVLELAAYELHNGAVKAVDLTL